jgi:hypothetical protein
MLKNSVFVMRKRRDAPKQPFDFPGDGLLHTAIAEFLSISTACYKLTAANLYSFSVTQIAIWVSDRHII